MSRALALLALAAAASIGCAMSGGSSNSQSSGAGGNSSGAGATNGGCLTDSCVPALNTPAVMAVEIDPPSSSPSGVTQILGRDVSTLDPYQASAAVTVTAGFAAPSGGSIPSSSDVVLTIPPTIPGRPDLSFQSVGVSPDNRSITATLVVPEDLLDAASTLSLVPLPPADQAMPVYNFAMPVSPMMMASLPGDDFVVSGQIQLANQMTPQSTFVARAFQAGGQVSNAALTQADGTFQVRIPSAAAATPVTIQLAPSAPPTAAPKDAWFVSKAITATPGKSLGVITMPSYNAPVTYDIVVAHGQDGIAGVNVRVQATLGDATTNGTVVGTASYISSGGTDMKGIAALSFLPATTNGSMSNASIAYTVTATPPIGSTFAVKCETNVTPLAGGGSGSTGTAMTLATFTLEPRPVVTGTVRTAAGATLSGVTVTASGAPDPSAMGCPAPGAVTASTTTDAFGGFSLPLDPGTYQLDYDPPAGSSAPRMTELNVSIAQTTSIAHDVWLPNGARVTGKVVGRDGTPVGSATVRFFQQLCSGQDGCFGPARTPPLLVGKALTGPDGSFRMIVPVPSSS